MTIAAASWMTCGNAYARPWTSTTTIGVPVAATASARRTWAAGRVMSAVSLASPSVRSPVNHRLAPPRASTTTSASRGGCHGPLDRLVPQVLGECASGLGPDRCARAPELGDERAGTVAVLDQAVGVLTVGDRLVPRGHRVLRAVHRAELALDDRLVGLAPGGVGVGRELQRRRVGMRADHGNVETARAQREEPGVLGQHDRATGQLLGEVAPLSGRPRRCRSARSGRDARRAPPRTSPAAPAGRSGRCAGRRRLRARPPRRARRRTRTGWASPRPVRPRSPAGPPARRRPRPAAGSPAARSSRSRRRRIPRTRGCRAAGPAAPPVNRRPGCRRCRSRSSSPIAGRRAGSPPRRGRRTGRA